MEVRESLNKLDARHRRALEWFLSSLGGTVTWPDTLPDGTILATRAKGIFKPEWSNYALSVRQTRNTDYPDHPPAPLPDGSWLYEYHQEGHDPTTRDRYFTNTALLRCSKDQVPVGVLRQDPQSENEGYRVLGLASVIRWEGGYFLLGGASKGGVFPEVGTAGELAAIAALATQKETELGSFDPNGLVDAREKIMASIVRRRGQASFRATLLEAYGGRCAVSNCDEAQALEAAHIIPYMGAETNHPTNGLLLRADIHTLFDVGLLAVDTATMTILLSPELRSGSYASLESAKLRLPAVPTLRPSKSALDLHREWAGL
jgi:putative restriction endonuclease